MISIIMPVYNCSKLLHKSVGSVLAQKYTDWELIAVDDGSNDDSLQVLREYEGKDSRIRVFHEENKGQAAARNFGLDNAQGDYISFIDADDYVSPDFLSKLIGLMESYNADMVQCNYEMGTDYVFHNSDRLQIYTFTGQEFLREYFNPQIPGIGGITCIKLYAKRLFDEVRFPEGRIHEDVAVLYKLIYASKKVVNTSEKLYYYYMSPDSTMRKRFTLKRLDWLTAFEEKLEFLWEKEEYALYERSLQEYIGVALKLYYLLKRNMPEEKAEQSRLLGEAKRYRVAALKSHEIRLPAKVLFIISFTTPYLAGFACDRMIP